VTPLADRPETSARTPRWLLWGIIVGGGAAPLILYWLQFGGLATVTPPQAKELLRRQGESALLVDVRPADDYRAGHIDGATSWPLDEILALKHPGDLPDRFRNKRLLMVCRAGVGSTRAARHLAGLGVEGVVNVRGGIQEWIGSAAGAKAEVFDRWRTASGETVEFPFRRSPWIQQLAAVVCGFVIKPVYTLLSLALAIVLWRSKAADLAALRWAMVSFFVGENCCLVNYLLFHGTSYLLEYFHMLGMLLCFGFAAYAVLEGVDRRILMLSDPDRKCASLSLCRRCVKYADAPCGLKRMFFLILPACIVLALMPLCADWAPGSYNTEIFGTPYGYSHLWYQQAFEVLYCPIVAVLLLTASLLILSLKRDDPLPSAKLTFAAAMGPLVFGFFRLVLTSFYARSLAWSAFWEESTELLFIVAVGFVLWTFREGLSPKNKEEPCEQQTGRACPTATARTVSRKSKPGPFFRS